MSDRTLGAVAGTLGYIVLIVAIGPGLALRLLGVLIGITLIGFGAVLLMPPSNDRPS